MEVLFYGEYVVPIDLYYYMIWLLWTWEFDLDAFLLQL